MANEANTCRKFVLPKLYSAGWNDDQINEQQYFTDGRIVVVGRKHYRKAGKKPIIFYDTLLIIQLL